MARRFLALLLPLLLLLLLLPALAFANRLPRHYFHNEVTGASRWEEPEDPVGHLAEDGRRYYVNPDTGDSQWEFPGDTPWTEHLDHTHDRSYFHNANTGESVWDRPAELGWRVIDLSDEEYEKLHRMGDADDDDVAAALDEHFFEHEHELEAEGPSEPPTDYEDLAEYDDGAREGDFDDAFDERANAFEGDDGDDVERFEADDGDDEGAGYPHGAEMEGGWEEPPQHENAVDEEF